MEDIIIYSVGALAVRGLRRAVFGPSREEKLSQEVKQLQGVIAQQSARLQQLEETLKLPATQVPQDALPLALPGRPAETLAGETADGHRPPLKRPAPDGPSDAAAPVAKRSRWSIFPVARRRSVEEAATPPSSPLPSNRAAVVLSSSNPSTSTDQSASADMIETSASESSGTSSGSEEESSGSDAADKSSDGEESSSEEEDFSDEEESSEDFSDDGSAAVSASSIISGSESESEAEDEPSLVKSASKSTSGSSGSSSKSTSQTPSTSGPSSSSKELSQADSEAVSPEISGDVDVADDSCPASSVPDCSQRVAEVLKSFGDLTEEIEDVSFVPNDESDDSSDSDSNVEGSKDTEDSSSGDSDSKSEEIDAEDAAFAPEDQPAPPAAEEQAAIVSPTEDQGAGEVVVDGTEEVQVQMRPEEELEMHREAQNRILCQVQEQIASAIYGLHIADSSLAEEEIMSDLQQMVAGVLPDSPQDAPEKPNQEEPHEQPLLSSNSDAAAAAALSDGVHLVQPAERPVADSNPSDSKDIEVAAEIVGSPIMGSPVVTVAATWNPPELLAERSGSESRARRSPKRSASGEDLLGVERRIRKRPRTLCSRLFAYLPRPLRTLRRIGGRSYWRGGARRRASSTSDSSQDQAAHAPEALLADPAAAEEQATSGTAVIEQGSVLVATPDAMGNEAADAATHEGDDSAQDEAAADAAFSGPALRPERISIQASGIFLTEHTAADDELSEEEKALLALADAEEQARLAIARFTQAPATQEDITPAVDLDSRIFALGSPQKTPVDEEWGDLSPASPVYGSNPAAVYSPSLCRQHDYSGLSQDEYARSLSPLNRRSRSRSRNRSGSPHRPSYSRGRSLSPCPGQGQGYTPDLSPARHVASLSPPVRRSSREPRKVSSPIRSPSPRRSELAQADRSIPSLSPFSRRSRSGSVGKPSRSPSCDVCRGHSRGCISDTSRSGSHSRDESRGRSRSRELSGPRRKYSSSPSYSPTKRSRSFSPIRHERNEGTPSRSRSAERVRHSLSRGQSHGDLSPVRRLRRRVIACIPSPVSRSPSRSRSCDGGWGRHFNKQSPRYAASASPRRSRSPFSDGCVEKELGSPPYSSYKKGHIDATDDILRQMVRNCEDLKATPPGEVAAYKAAKSPILSQPGGRKRGVLLSPSRSPSPISSAHFSNPGEGVSLPDVQATFNDVMGCGAGDRGQVIQDDYIIRDASPVLSNPAEADAVYTIRSPDMRSPSPDRLYERVPSAVWNPDASQHLRAVSRSRSRSPAASIGRDRSPGSPCRTQEPRSPQPPSVLLSGADAQGDAPLRWQPRAGTPVPDDGMVERAVRAALHADERPERSPLATQLARGLSDAWQHDMHHQRRRVLGSDDDEMPGEGLFRRRMRFARRIFERHHRRRTPARAPVEPHVPLFVRNRAAKLTGFGHALGRQSVASAPAWMPMADFGNDSVEELVDLTQADSEEDRQEPQPPTDMSPKDPQPSYSQPRAGAQAVTGSDLGAEAARRSAPSEPDLCDAELEWLLQQNSG